jgi:AcrR family transcriptional regulator
MFYTLRLVVTSTENTRSRLSAPDRRAQIIEASREVFLRSGLAGTRVRELSAAAGVNEALLYRHFESKEALFEAAVTEPLEAAVNELIRIGGLQNQSERDLSSAAARSENLEEVMGLMIAAMAELGPLLGVMLFADFERGQIFYRERFVPALDQLAMTVSDVEGVWPGSDFDPRLTVFSGVATALMLSLDQRFGGDLLADRERVVRELARYILLGLEPR